MPWPLRQACAQQVVARFLPDGRLGRIDLRFVLTNAGLNGIVGEGLRKRCRQHLTEVVSCTLTWNGLK